LPRFKELLPVAGAIPLTQSTQLCEDVGNPEIVL
jgi:hypothetical protein